MSAAASGLWHIVNGHQILSETSWDFRVFCLALASSLSYKWKFLWNLFGRLEICKQLFSYCIYIVGTNAIAEDGRKFLETIQPAFHLLSGFVQAMEFWKNYGILKRKFHIWKNYGIWAKRPYLWKNYGIFVLVEKSACFHYVRTSKCSFNVCCFGYHFTRPRSKNLPGYTASLGRVNTC